MSSKKTLPLAGFMWLPGDPVCRTAALLCGPDFAALPCAHSAPNHRSPGRDSRYPGRHLTGIVKILPETKFAQVHPEVDQAILRELEEGGYLDQTIIQSFEADSLSKLHRLNPQARLCALSGLWEFNVGSPPGDAQVVCPMSEMVLLNPAMIRQAHQEGRQVFIYFGMIENPTMMKIMRYFGADGLIVNDPKVLKAQD